MSLRTDGITTGVTGGRWRASVTSFGSVEPWSTNTLGTRATVDWHIAADDRWHSPRSEATVRQRRVNGTPVVETRVRIPDGDAVQCVYSVADHGGLTIIEVANESPLPIAVAFTSAELLSERLPSAPIAGISLPPESVAFPIGHHASLTVAIPHSARAPGVFPTGLASRLPAAAAVARGWIATVDRAGRLLLPESGLCDRVIAARCELALCGPPTATDDPAGCLLAIDQLVRMGESAGPWLPELAHALELAAKSPDESWVLSAALAAADRVLAVAGESRARRDLALVRSTLPRAAELPEQSPAESSRLLAQVEQRLVVLRDGGAQLLCGGLPSTWIGVNFEVFGLPTDATGTISFAVRWHGDRPAILWEQVPGKDGPVGLSSPVLAPQWTTSEVKGEALWSALG
ncbi:MAG: hypothetical protein HY826_05370 [Actinobacteria bacterium]|nr:hypothetical protein [Actinomycetota bacterium]